MSDDLKFKIMLIKYFKILSRTDLIFNNFFIPP